MSVKFPGVETSLRRRKSQVRLGIMDYLSSETMHPTAEQIYMAVQKNFPRVSFATIYRNLNILVKQGQLNRIESSREQDRFDANLKFHAHFHCHSCGKLYDLHMAVELLIKEAASKIDHKITDQRIDFFGTCTACSSRANA